MWSIDPLVLWRAARRVKDDRDARGQVREWGIDPAVVGHDLLRAAPHHLCTGGVVAPLHNPTGRITSLYVAPWAGDPPFYLNEIRGILANVAGRRLLARGAHPLFEPTVGLPAWLAHALAHPNAPRLALPDGLPPGGSCDVRF